MARGYERLVCGFAVLLTWCSTALGAGPLSLQEAIGRALANHSALKGAEARVRAAEAAHGAVWETYAPQVIVFGGAQHNSVKGSTTTTNPGLLGSTTTVSQRFSQSASQTVVGANVEQFLVDFGSFPSQRIATEERYGAQKQALASQVLDVTLNVKVAYYTLLRARRFVQYQQEIVDRRQTLIESSEKSGARRGSADVRTDLPLADARIALNKSESELADAELVFLDALGEPGGPAPPLVDDVTLKVVLITPQQMVERALNARPELMQAEAVVRAQQADADAAWASYLPRFETYFNVTNLSAFGKGDSDQLTVLGGGLEVRIPTTWIASTNRLSQANAGLEEAKARADELRQAVRLAVARNNAALAEAAERVRITNELAENAERLWQERQARAATPEGNAAYATLYDARVRLIQALYDAKIAEAKLERAIGFDF